MRSKRSYRCILIGLAVTVLCLTCIDAAQAEVVHFPDKNLEAAVRNTIKKYGRSPILDTDLVGTGFTTLSARSAGIVDLTGLESCTDLTELDLMMNQIGDISTLAGLTNLESVRLEGNPISGLVVGASEARITYRNIVRRLKSAVGL